MPLRRTAKKLPWLRALGRGVRRFPRRSRKGLRRLKWHRQRRFGLLDPQIKRTYLAGHDVAKLHIGCGAHMLEGWLNSDYFPTSTAALHFDATAPFPLPDDCFDYVYSEHMIEHVGYSSGEFMLRECFRVLKPNGRVRIATPDFRFLLDVYPEPATPLHQTYTRWMAEQCMPNAPYMGGIFVLNSFVRRWGHQFIYDEQSLTSALEQAGFLEVTGHELQESEDGQLRNLANEDRMPDGFVRLETMVLEAVKRRP